MIKAQRILTPFEEIKQGAVLIVDGKIETVLAAVPAEGDYRVLDYPEGILSPGFIDVHVHGANGHDTMDGTYEALNSMSRYLATTGTTGFLPTTVTAGHEDILRAISAVKDSKHAGTEGAAILGIHLEGPYINELNKGAQNEAYIRKPNPDELKTYIDLLGEDFKLITLAPELDEDFKTIQLAKLARATVSAGHSCCSYDLAIQAIDAGVSHATHLFNGMSLLHHREPGLVGAMLTDSRVTTEIIADGIHLHPSIIQMVLAAKGMDKVALITDCIRAGNLPDGEYELGGLQVTVTKGIARTSTGNLAGSTLSMMQAVKNVVKFCRISLKDAVHLASRNTAATIGLADRKGTIEAGKDADLIVFSSDFKVQLTVVGGQVKYQPNTGV